MNRHYARVLALQSLYEADFRAIKNDCEKILERHLTNLEIDGENTDFAKELVKGTAETKDSIDSEIEEVAPEWPINNVAVLDRNILRMSIYELKNMETPPKVVINEAIELAKSFGSETSSKFINGVLGTVYRKSGKYQEEPNEEGADE